MKQKLSNILYATGIGTKPAFIKEPECTIGSTMQDPSAASSCRPATSSIAISPVKISYVIQGLALLLDDRNCPAFCGIGKSLYLEVGSEQAVISENSPDSYSIRKSENLTLSAQMTIAAILLYEVALKPTSTLKYLQACLKSYDKTGYVPAVQAGALCDAFYYEFRSKSYVEVESGLQSEEIDAMQRQDKPQPIILNGSAIRKPAQIKTEERKKKPAVVLPQITEIMDKAKAGEYQVAYAWSTEAECYRQSLDTLDGFIPNQTYISLLEKIKLRTGNVLSRIKKLGLNLDEPADRVKAIGNDYVNVTLSGKPGTGKTRLAYALGAATGMPVYTISNSHNTDEDTYTGLTKMVDGHPTSVATDTVKCFENGGILLLEEINLPQAAVVMGALGQALEFPFILMKDGYQPIRRHPLCIIISTMNTGTAGSKAVSQPFANRFKQSFVLDDPTKEDFIRILGNTGAEGNVCRWVYECYERVVAGIENDNAMADVESILLSLSVRTCIGAIENIQEGMEPREAVKNSIIGKISEQDREVAKACARIVDGMRNPTF